MLAFALAWIVSQTPGIEVRLTGVAKNAKGGAVLLVNGAPVYVEQLAEWPVNVVDTNVEASGELVDFAYLPEATRAENGEISQGTEPGTTQRVLRHAQWRSLAPKPAEGGLHLAPTQRAGALLAGVTVVCAGVAVGLALSANADARVFELTGDTARELGRRNKTIAAGVMTGVAGASLIAAIVLLVLPPAKSPMVPVAMVSASGGMVGVFAWF